ncbi:MAG TPA: DUF2891 domain-containing protein [Burkholderiales bacterium]|nr:DUF2891 domain-containing protein [Burkholderiales bacterium]
MDISRILAAEADRLAALCLDVLRRRYPHKLDHLILHERDNPLPGEIHPVFSGCYDWHSSVHMHWSLLRLYESVQDADLRSGIGRHFESRFTPALVAVERAYAGEPQRGGFERPYGWAWLLKLHAELDARGSGDARIAGWAAALAPFASEVAGRLAAFLSSTPYPVRYGAHPNSAFAMVLARDYALALRDERLARAIEAAARSWFLHDEDCPARYEPGATDFLSPGLCEALLMSRLLGADLTAWWARFDRSGKAIGHWRVPAVVADAADGQLVHIAGLNLSRAWCLIALRDAVPPEQRDTLISAAEDHWKAGWPYVTGGEFVATHWLLSFAMLCSEALADAEQSINAEDAEDAEDAERDHGR